MKKRLCLILSILIIAAMLCSGDFAYAFMEYDEGDLSLLQEGDFDIEISEKHGDNASILSVRDKIYKSLLNVDSSINVFAYRVPLEDVGAVLSDVINDNPDLFYVSSSYRTTNISGYTYAYSIIPYYSMAKDEIESAKEVFNQGVAKALSAVDSSMSDLQKALTIHDYICDRAIYPADYETNDKDIYHSAYGFFYDEIAVCAGYTLSFSYLMHQLGIECEYVTSSAMQHAWNKIKLGENWYNVDITYDNNDFQYDYNTAGRISHRFFMKSDEFFSGEQGIYHKDGKTADICNADSNDLDDEFWHEVGSRIYVVDGNYYYLSPDFDNYTAVLIKRDLSGNEEQIGDNYFAPVYSSSIGRHDAQENCDYWIPVQDVFIRLTYLDGRFYITAEKDIYSQLLNGKRFSIVSADNYIVGCAEREGELIYNLYGDNAQYTLDKLQYFRDNITTSQGGYNNYPDVNNDGYVNAKDYAQIIS